MFFYKYVYIYNKTRRKDVVKPRQIVMYVLREDFDISHLKKEISADKFRKIWNAFKDSYGEKVYYFEGIPEKWVIICLIR